MRHARSVLPIAALVRQESFELGSEGMEQPVRINRFIGVKVNGFWEVLGWEGQIGQRGLRGCVKAVLAGVLIVGLPAKLAFGMLGGFWVCFACSDSSA